MNLVIASGTYPPELGGMATFVKNAAAILAARGHKVSVAAYADKSDRFSDKFSVTLVSRQGGKLARYLRYFFTLKRLAASADLVFAQDLVSSGLPAAAYCRIFKKRLALRLGGDFLWEKRVEQGKTVLPLRQFYGEKKDWRDKVYLAIYRFVLDTSCLTVFNSRLQADLYKQVFRLPDKKIASVPNPLPASSAKRKPAGSGLLYIGRFIKLKNLETLLRAYSRLQTEHKLILIGEGPGKARLESLIIRLGLGAKVEIRPPVPHERIQNVLAACHLLIIPSLTELNPNIVLEAVAAGLPVLVTAENGLPEEISRSLVTFDPLSEEDLSDQLAMALQEKNYREYARSLGRLNFAFSWDDAVSRFERLFIERT